MTRHYFVTSIFALMAIFGARAADIPYQSCSYSIQCDCAFIHATAAHATATFSCYGGVFNAKLDGCSVPIFNTLFCVSDNLQARFVQSGTALPSEEVLSINGVYRKPHPNHPEDPNLPCNYRTIWGEGTLSADATTMEAVNLTADMLCLFYYAKTFDFGTLPQGVPQYADVSMPGGGQRTLEIVYDGLCEYAGGTAYHITTNFSYEGRMSSYPISVIIDPSLGLPVQLSAHIAIGMVQMNYEY